MDNLIALIGRNGNIVSCESSAFLDRILIAKRSDTLIGLRFTDKVKLTRK